MPNLKVRYSGVTYSIPLYSTKTAASITPNAYITLRYQNNFYYLYLYNTALYASSINGKHLKVRKSGSTYFAGPAWQVHSTGLTTGTYNNAAGGTLDNGTYPYVSGYLRAGDSGGNSGGGGGKGGAVYIENVGTTSSYTYYTGGGGGGGQAGYGSRTAASTTFNYKFTPGATITFSHGLGGTGAAATSPGYNGNIGGIGGTSSFAVNSQQLYSSGGLTGLQYASFTGGSGSGYCIAGAGGNNVNVPANPGNNGENGITINQNTGASGGGGGTGGIGTYGGGSGGGGGLGGGTNNPGGWSGGSGGAGQTGANGDVQGTLYYLSAISSI